VQDFDAILELVDMVMVARGDMAVELGHENVPVAQKMIIDKCIKAGKPVVTATQMLESMIKSPVPTRAEVSDVANAIFDGTDAVMLSEETTLGEFPVEAVRVMSTIAEKIESSPVYIERFREAKKLRSDLTSSNVSDALASEVVDLAHFLGAKAIVALTNTGKTARILSRYKPARPILAFTPDEKTFNQLLVNFGCEPVAIPKIKTLNEALPLIRQYVLKNKIAKKGDKVVVAAGTPFGKPIDTNTVLVETI
jgi:pyruvate kinase